jgi:ankyrin repeat protein
VVNALLDKGADLHAKDREGVTPGHEGCWNGQNNIAAMLWVKDVIE